MRLRHPARPALPLLLFCAAAMPAPAQQLIGYVNTRDADITGASDVLDGQAVLTGSVGITAKDHTAPITLGRGGSVRVCQTSVLHVTGSRGVTTAAPLLFSLDRGSIEIQTNGTPTDAIMTPDMRFTVRNAGPLDLRLRVARNGDTCVENRGSVAPTLAVSDPFGETMYEVGPGQHLLFEHGSLHEVVDHETSPCGCPEPKGMSVADALLASGGAKTAAPASAPAPTPAVTVAQVPVAPIAVVQAPAPAPAPVPAPVPPPVQASAAVPAAAVQPSPARAAVVPPAPAAAATVPPASSPASDLAAVQATEQAAEQAAAQAAIRAAENNAKLTAQQAAERHPFPAAISEGLAPPAAPPPVAPGQTHVQIADSLSYNAPVSAPAAAAASRAKKTPATPLPATPPAPAAKPPAPPPERPHDLVSFIGNFFRKLFGRS
ncbi:MAG TPA: hypothetical protein VGN01_14500 [Acidobacteriaceae bacterium]